MGKFDHILIISDIDGTLFNRERIVSEENIKAIKYFQSEGGLFTIATGRVVASVNKFLTGVPLNAPAITHNGGVIYDFNKKRYILEVGLMEDALPVVLFIQGKLPYVGIEIYHGDNIYVCRYNETVREHMEIEQFKPLEESANKVPFPWVKVMFVQKREKTPEVMEVLSKSGFGSLYTFSKSSSQYYEMLKIGADKGTMLLRLCDILGIRREKTIALGDNENDVNLLKSAQIGFAVSNAKPEALAAADFITVSNQEHAVARVIEQLDRKEIIL